MQRICDRTNASGYKAGQGAGSNEVGRSGESDGPHDYREGNDCDGWDGQQALQPLIPDHHLAPMRGWRIDQAYPCQCYQCEKRHHRDSDPGMAFTTWAGVFI
jgi:hypothetical protein